MFNSPGPILGVRLSLFDQYQRLFPRERTSMPVIIIGLDEHALDVAGQWPWPRTKVADLLRKLQAMKPAAIGFDITFNEPDRMSPAALANAAPNLPEVIAKEISLLPSNDLLFAGQIKASPVVLALTAEDDSRAATAPKTATVLVDDAATNRLRSFPGFQSSLPVLVEAAATQGVINGDTVGGITRRAPVLARVADTPMAALSLAMWQAATGSPVLAQQRPDGLIEASVAELRIPLQPDGGFWIWFGRQDSRRVHSAGDVLTGKLDPAVIENKLVLIGATGIGLLDYKTTPLGELVPGVDIHAQVIEQMFDGAYLNRPAWAHWLEVGLLLTAAFIITRLSGRLNAIRTLVLFGAMLTLLLAGGLVAFRMGGLLLDVAWPALGMVGAAGLSLADGLSKSDKQRRMLREQAAHIAGELSAAQRIQMGLLPNPQEVFAGERRFTVAALLQPARTVGGDFYDCFMLDENRLFFIVADVSGKGLPAALFMAAVKSHIKSAAMAADEHLNSVMRRAQADIARENPESLFVTAFAGVLDASTGMLTYSNAGHEPPLARKPGGEVIRLQRADGPPLGALDNFEYSQGSRQMSPGEWLCVVTDGVTEANNPAGELFGATRLQTTLESPTPAEWPGEIVKRLQDAVDKFAAGAEQADDLTLLAVRWNSAT